jgi:hypothetical protein
MDGYKNYASLKKGYPDAEVKKYLSAAETVALIDSARFSVVANCGEVNRFNDPLVCAAIVRLLDRGGTFSTTCGKYIHGGGDEANPRNRLFDTLFDKRNNKHFDEGRVRIWYTDADPLTQVFYGGFHALVIDGGDVIFAEEPHGYIRYVNENHEGILIKGERELADAFGDFRTTLTKYNEIKSLDDPLLAKNIIWDNDPRWFEGKNNSYNFKTREDYEDRLWTHSNN